MTFDWWLDRIDVARWNNETLGSRDLHAACPVHGGSDSLHITETTDKVLVHCFATGCAYESVIEALRDDAQATQTHVIVRSGRTPRPAYSPTGEPVSDQATRRWDPPLRQRGITPSQLHGGLPGVVGVKTIIFTEGHGPAIALNDAGIPAVCSVTGKSSAIDSTGAAFLFGKRVILSPDVGGEEHMERCDKVIAAVASEVLIAPAWPEALEDGQDAADFIERYDIAAMAEHFAKAVLWAPQDTVDDALEPICLADISPEEPASLELDRLHPTDHSVLFGYGGTGKGVIAAEWAARLSHGDVVLVLDYEKHTTYEWRPRVEAFGGVLRRVFVIQPPEPIQDIADVLHEKVIQLSERFEGARVWLMVDSVTYAIAPLEVERSVAAATYSNAIGVIAAPTLSLAHTTKANDDPRHPFGSVFWSNGARVTIGVTRTGEALDSPRRVTCKKSNQRVPFQPYEIDWAWSLEDGPPMSLSEAPTDVSLGDRARDAMWGRGLLTAKDVSALVEQDGFTADFTERGLLKAMEKHPDIDDDGVTGRGKTKHFRAGIEVVKGSSNWQFE